jgi:hypothetical protein
MVTIKRSAIIALSIAILLIAFIAVAIRAVTFHVPFSNSGITSSDGRYTVYDLTDNTFRCLVSRDNKVSLDKPSIVYGFALMHQRLTPVFLEPYWAENDNILLVYDSNTFDDEAVFFFRPEEKTFITPSMERILLGDTLWVEWKPEACEIDEAKGVVSFADSDYVTSFSLGEISKKALSTIRLEFNRGN